MSSASTRAGYQRTVDLGDLLEFTEGDLLVLLQEQRSRILERTARGVDYQNIPFASYNDERPFYWYPAGPVGRNRSESQLKRDKAAVTRAGRSLGMSFRTKEQRDQNLSRSGLGLKFRSYRAFKFEYLGRSTVDLYGPRAPHMMQSMVIKAGSLTEQSIEYAAQANVDLDQNPTPATEGTLGIYGEAGDRASGINSDDRPKGMPLRRFFAVSTDDEQAMAETTANRIARRMQARVDAFSGSEAWKNDFDLGF